MISAEPTIWVRASCKDQSNILLQGRLVWKGIETIDSKGVTSQREDILKCGFQHALPGMWPEQKRKSKQTDIVESQMIVRKFCVTITLCTLLCRSHKNQLPMVSVCRLRLLSSSSCLEQCSFKIRSPVSKCPCSAC